MKTPLIPGLAVLSLLLPTAIAAQSSSLGRPFAILENTGQWDTRAVFQSKRSDQVTWFVRDGWRIDLVDRVRHEGAVPEGSLGRPSPNPEKARAVVIGMSFERSRTKSVVGESRSSGRYNFVRGNDPDGWRFAVPAYARIRYESLYPGVDATIQEGSGLFRYDLQLDRGADLTSVVVRCEGMDSMTIESDGSLVLRTSIGTLRQSAPIAWHVGPAGKRLPVKARFTKRGAGRFGFTVDGLRKDLPLVIDPDVSWGTFLGGTEWEDTFAMTRGLLGGPQAPLTVCGPTRSTIFPTTTGPTHAGNLDCYFARLDPSLSANNQLVVSTLFGDTEDDFAYDVEVDILGNTTVVGITRSTGFPATAGSAQPAHGGGDFDGFVSQFDSNGVPTFSTFLGSQGGDRVVSVVMDNLEMVISGYTTSSTGMPVSSAVVQTFFGGIRDAFVAKIDSTGSSVDYFTYLGGTGGEGWGFSSTSPAYYDMATGDLARDPVTGQVAFCGRGGSSNYPRWNPYQVASPGGHSGIITVLDVNQPVAANQLIYSTFLGASATDAAEAVTFVSSSVLCVAGWTYSTSFPTTPGAAFTTHVGPNQGNGRNDAIVCWLDMSQTGAAQLTYSTFLGGINWDGAGEVAVDKLGVAHVCGWCSDGFPTTPGAIFENVAGSNGRGWYARVHPGGNGSDDLVYSTQLGDPLATVGAYAADVVLTGEGGTFVCGNTATSNIPTPNGSSSSVQGSRDGWIFHIWGPNHGASIVGQSTPAACAGSLQLSCRGWPEAGSTNFAIHGWDAEANAIGFLGVGLGPQANFGICGAIFHTTPLLLVGINADANGEVDVPLPIAAGTPAGSVYLQFAFGNSNCCLTATNTVKVTL